MRLLPSGDIGNIVTLIGARKKPTKKKNSKETAKSCFFLPSSATAVQISDRATEGAERKEVTPTTDGESDY